MTSTSDADETPRPRRRTTASAAPAAAPPAAPDAAPAPRRRRAAASSEAPAPTADDAPAVPPARRSRAKTADAAPAETAPTAAANPPAKTAARSTKAAPKAEPTARPAVEPPSPITPAAGSRTRTAAKAAAKPADGEPPASEAPTPTRRPRTRAAASPPDAVAASAPPPDAPIVDRGAPPPPGARPDEADGRRDPLRSGRRRRRGRGDGAREPGGYARGPVPPAGDVIRPRDAGDPRARDNQGGYGRDAGWRRDDGSRSGGGPRGDAQSGGQGGQAGPARGGGQGGGARDDRRTGGQQTSGGGRYDGGRGQRPAAGQGQDGGQRADAGRGGNRYDGGRGGPRPEGGRGQRFEGRGRTNGPYRERAPQRPPAPSADENWDAPAPGGLEVGGHAGADWVSYEDRMAGEEARRPAGQQVIGYIELSKNGNGIVRTGGLAGRNDPVVPMRLLRQLGLRSGDLIDALARGTQVVEVSQVNGHDPVDLAKRPNFDTLTAVHPDKALLVGATADNLTGRLLDLVAPVGRGQRGLIVAPPKAGKTTLLKDIANGLSHDPKLTLLICLVGERPEEVTDMRRSTTCTVLAADMDLPTEDHTRIAEICVEHAKRLMEEGKHVVILMDSLTRLARAYNLSIKGGGGRTLSGGMDAGALQPVRKFFGAARATDDGGSLTILATCLVDTGSRLDDLVYEEFKGTGNMEVHLDRKLSEQRLYPAVDIRRSGTRREELLFDAKMLEQVRAMRRQLVPLEPAAALVALLDALRKQPMPDGSAAPR